MRIVIVGAGVAGLAAGWRLAQAGASVELVERGIAGRGASWAAAGMLAPGAETVEAGESGLSPVGRFAQTARDLWPDFATELEQASGHGIGFRVCGSLIVAHDDRRARLLKGFAAGTAPSQWLEREALRARAPLVSRHALGALSVPGDAQVNNRALCPALMAALARHGARLRENCEATGLQIENGRARGVMLRDGVLAADAVLLANGAWLNGTGGVSGLVPAVKPAKGQMVALVPPEGVAPPGALLWGEGVYLVPHGRKVFAGATVEDAGFDRIVTGEAARHLRAAAANLVPAVSDWRMTEIWAGFRPRSANGAPILGETAVQGLYVAGGQFRNGILFAPAMASALRGLMLEGAAPAALRGSLEAFDPRRTPLRAAP